jgi:hypothetical protein
MVPRMVTIQSVPAWSLNVMADRGGAEPGPSCDMNRTEIRSNRND